MNTKKTKKELLAECVRIIDGWDLINGLQSEEDEKHLVNLLISSAVAAGIDPNKLQSLKAILGDRYKIIIVEKS